jgi:AcrR family transcriptional regulator
VYLEGFSVKKHLKTIQPVPTLFDKPAKDRILEASDKLFRIYGIRASLQAIAHHADSNVVTVVKYYKNQECLVSLFLKSLIELAEQYWREVEQKHPNDAEGRLRYWVFYEQGRWDDPVGPERLLARSAAELSSGHPKNPLLVEIEQYWQAERRRLVRLCKAANFREPGDLADKLLLLVHGLRNERAAFGHHAPSRLLPQAADDLMVAHGATRKPLFSWTED